MGAIAVRKRPGGGVQLLGGSIVGLLVINLIFSHRSPYFGRSRGRSHRRADRGV